MFRIHALPRAAVVAQRGYLMPRIFISYRQTDTIAIAGRIIDRLKAHFGQDNVFMEVDGNNQIVQGDRS